MKKEWIQKGKGDRLLVFFAGWGQDVHPFSQLQAENWDVLMLYDYNDLNLPVAKSEISRYKNAELVAWSLGVWVASQMPTEWLSSFRTRIAVNGTLMPIDEHLGIPPVIFDGTIANFSQVTRQKFFRRMCGSYFQQYQKFSPLRSLESQCEELKQFRIKVADEWISSSAFDKALVCSEDLIFPAKHQLQFWGEELNVPTKQLPLPHFPFYRWETWDSMMVELLSPEGFFLRQDKVAEQW
ncbi:pimeloyl-ACP methyl esterase BioG family protein [Limibacter armeniacum]|uniref:DUF452 family protein n=1 Tax=Limibacter armeniacum TaxID=466084 RepID=UPI002FE567F7